MIKRYKIFNREELKLIKKLVQADIQGILDYLKSKEKIDEETINDLLIELKIMKKLK